MKSILSTFVVVFLRLRHPRVIFHQKNLKNEKKICARYHLVASLTIDGQTNFSKSFLVAWTLRCEAMDSVKNLASMFGARV